MITCPRCGLLSHHPEDERNRYCANCDAFHEELAGLPPYRACGVQGCRCDVSRSPCPMHGRRR
ncbi:MAG TPA: hypothetical protein VG370_34825 [Chloroflexota bacterium]|jgi:hypothetical protein|nr:hypothetical protein [Chloroflexota bacterium]